MILVDTSLWVEHLRSGRADLAKMLESGFACTHDFVIGEIACGTPPQRAEHVSLMQFLPRLDSVTSEEILHFIERRHLMGRGLGYVDVHLLAACVLHGARMWTQDRPLRRAAVDAGVAYLPN